uniref:Uncharacterized protein n=1 Tax=Arion vulgaris TaxID=1028688 RepID=A0A0B7AE59_9EUPU
MQSNVKDQDKMSRLDTQVTSVLMYSISTKMKVQEYKQTFEKIQFFNATNVYDGT